MHSSLESGTKAPGPLILLIIYALLRIVAVLVEYAYVYVFSVPVYASLVLLQLISFVKLFVCQAAHFHIRLFPLRGDIQSVWAGHRPLISQTSEAKDTAGVVRSHTVLVDHESGLISLMGGKWTTYRRMAQVRTL